MKTALLLAGRNLLRSKKYSLGLFSAYFFTALLCLAFFLFAAGAGEMYASILARQASGSYVRLALPFSESNPPDLTEAERALLPGLPGVTGVERWRFVLNGADFISLSGRQPAGAAISMLATEAGLPEGYRTEFLTLYGQEPLVCGRAPQQEGECAVSAAFVSFLGAASAEELIGQIVGLTDFGGRPVTGEMRVVGVIRSELTALSDMEETGRFFVFLRPGDVRLSDGMWYYKLYAGFADLPALREAAAAAAPANVTVSQGNNSFAMQKLGRMGDFVSAVLALLAALCLAACTAAVGGAAVLRFHRNAAFFRAAFSVGLSRNKLLLCFLFEFLLTALAAFVCALPVSFGMVGLVARLTSVFAGSDLSVPLSGQGVLLALLPLAVAAGLSLGLVRGRIARV